MDHISDNHNAVMRGGPGDGQGIYLSVPVNVEFHGTRYESSGEFETVGARQVSVLRPAEDLTGLVVMVGGPRDSDEISNQPFVDYIFLGDEDDPVEHHRVYERSDEYVTLRGKIARVYRYVGTGWKLT